MANLGPDPIKYGGTLYKARAKPTYEMIGQSEHVYVLPI